MANELQDTKTIVHEFAQQLRTLAIQAHEGLEDEVNRLIRNSDKQEKRIEHLLDRLLDFCYDERILLLFKRLCRYYYTFNPVAAADYVLAYRKMWDTEEQVKDDQNDERKNTSAHD